MRTLELFDRNPTHAANVLEGFRYQPALIDSGYEKEVLRRVRDLPFREFEFHGYLGKRRIVSFGWRYRYSGAGKLEKADEIPEFLFQVRSLAAAFADLEPAMLEQVLITEYAAGAGIGWHRDKPVFDRVVGISLLAPCILRFRRKAGAQVKGARASWERTSIKVEPRSAYLLTGPARAEWEHSISAMDELRYSITFRSLRQ